MKNEVFVQKLGFLLLYYICSQGSKLYSFSVNRVNKLEEVKCISNVKK